jgi:hypothetical protein
MGVDIESWAEVYIDGMWYAADKDLIDGRSMELFFVLRDWGDDYEHRVPPLTTREGLPPDVSIVVKKDAEEWGGNPAWLTLEEMQEADLPWNVLGNHARTLFE